LCTLLVGYRALWLRTPWQASLITAYATYVGVFGEGFIIDTDHWRHYFLLLGLVWGLSVASERSWAGVPAGAAINRGSDPPRVTAR
jgi:hypothetical protein